MQSVSDVHGSDPQSGQEPLTSLREVPTPSGPPCAGGGLRRPPGGSGGDAGLSGSNEKPPLRSGYLLLIRSSLLAKEPSGSFSPPGLRADLDCFGLFWVLISDQLILAASDSELEHTQALSPSFSPRSSALDQPSRSAGVTRAGQEFRAPLARLALRLKPRRQQRWLSSLSSSFTLNLLPALEDGTYAGARSQLSSEPTSMLVTLVTTTINKPANTTKLTTMARFIFY